MSPVFWLISTFTLAGALAAVVLKNTVHCALALTIAFVGLAMLFLGLDAQFAGFTEIMVYVGAVAILIVFAILLTKGSETPTDTVYSRYPVAGLVAAAAVFAALGGAVLASAGWLPNQLATPGSTAKDIGFALVGRYVLPLEIVALLLTVATIGAVIVAMHEKEGKQQ